MVKIRHQEFVCTYFIRIIRQNKTTGTILSRLFLLFIINVLILHKLSDLIEMLEASLATEAVHEVELLRLHLYATNLKRLFGSDDECVAFLSLTDDVFHLSVIHLMTALHAVVNGRIFA